MASYRVRLSTQHKGRRRDDAMPAGRPRSAPHRLLVIGFIKGPRKESNPHPTFRAGARPPSLKPSS